MARCTTKNLTAMTQSGDNSAMSTEDRSVSGIIGHAMRGQRARIALPFAALLLLLLFCLAPAWDAGAAIQSKTNRVSRASTGKHSGSSRKIGKTEESKEPVETVKEVDPLETIRGRHMTVSMPHSYWRKIANSNEFVEFLDKGFDKEAELMIAKSDITLRGDALKCWGLGGGGTITIDWPALADVMDNFSRSNIFFGVLHEMGHCFDEPGRPRWYKFPESCGECFANIPLSYAFDQLLTTNNGYRVDIGGRKTGIDFNDSYYLPQAAGYLDGQNEWTKIAIDQLHAFHLGLARRYGWDVYKKWFRACLTLEGQGMGPPGDYVHPDRPIVACALLSAFADADLVPEFQKWRFPVDQAKVDDAMKKYNLEKIIEAVDKQFSQELANGQITLDPLSMRIVKERAKLGVAKVSVAMIQLEDATVRYTLTGVEPTSTSPVLNAPVLLTKKCVVKAALFLPKQNKPVLTAMESVDPFSLPEPDKSATGKPATGKHTTGKSGLRKTSFSHH